MNARGQGMGKDLGAGVALLAFSVVFYWGSTELGTSFMADPVGPDGLPRALALILGVLSLILVAQSLGRLLAGRHAPAREQPEPPRRRHLLALGMLAIGAGYALIAEIVGYFLGIALVLLITILFQGARRSWRVPLVAAGGSLFFWLLFVALLSIGQPEGIWSRLLASLSA